MRSRGGWIGLLAWLAIMYGVGAGGMAWAGERPLQLVLIAGVNHHLRDPGHQFRYADDSALLALQVTKIVLPFAQVRVLATADDPGTAAGFEAAGIDPLPPTRAGVDLAFRDFSQAAHEARTRARSVEMFVYFAGFADPGGTLHLADQPLEMDTLMSLLEQVRPDQAFALFDAAHPARLSPGTNAPLEPPPVIPAAAELSYRPSYLGYLGATTSDVQLNNSQGGLLTSVALTGIAGAADLDGDGRISFFEWRQFVRMQIDIDKPFAPFVRAVGPRRDPLATVVDLRGLISSRLVVDGAVPNGVMEIREAQRGRMVAQWYHHQGYQDRICVPSGRLEVNRYSDRTPRKVQGADGQVLYVPNRVYPVEKATISVGPGEVVGYDLETRTSLVYLVPVDRGDGGAFPEGGDVVPLSGEEEVRLIGLLFRTTRPGELELPLPAWYLTARVALPAPLEVDFSSGIMAESSAGLPVLDGGAVRMARTVPRALRNRWYLARCFLFEYGQYEVRDVTTRDLDGNTYAHDVARAHQVRLGPGLRQTHVGAAVRWDLEESLTYGPLWIVGGGDGVGGQGGLRILSLSEVMLEGSVALMFRVGTALEVGPVAGVQIGLFHDNSPGTLLIQPHAGLLVRPRVIRE